MSPDRITNRALAATVAMVGLIVVMLQPAPNWNAIGVGVASLIAFGILWVLPGRRQAGKTRPLPARVEVTLHGIGAPVEYQVPSPRLLLEPPKYLELLEPGLPRTN